MPILSKYDFESSLKVYKIVFNGILIANLIVFGYSFIDFIFRFTIIFAVISFFLILFISYIISNKIQDSRVKDSFDSIKSLNNFSFILLILIYFPFIIFYFWWGGIIYLVLFFKSYNKLKRKEIYKRLRIYFILGLISFVIAVCSFFFYFLSFRAYIGPGFVLLGIALMNMKVIPYFSLKSSEKLAQKEKTRQLWNQIKLNGHNNESKNELVQEKKVVNAEFEPELVEQPEIIIKKEISQPILETKIVEAESKQQSGKKPELVPEIEISSKKVKPKKFGLVNFKINRKKVPEKIIRSKIAEKEAKTLILKKCPFCGKKREDLDVPFCYVCGFKF